MFRRDTATLDLNWKYWSKSVLSTKATLSYSASWNGLAAMPREVVPGASLLRTAEGRRVPGIYLCIIKQEEMRD